MRTKFRSPQICNKFQGGNKSESRKGKQAALSGLRFPNLDLFEFEGSKISKKNGRAGRGVILPDRADQSYARVLRGPSKRRGGLRFLDMRPVRRWSPNCRSTFHRRPQVVLGRPFDS